MHGQFFPCPEWGKNGVIFGVGNSSSTYTINRKINILVLGEGPTDRFDNTTRPEVKYSVNITRSRFKSTLHANNSFLYANGVKIYHFKTKDSKINISEIFQKFLQLITWKNWTEWIRVLFFCWPWCY